jgi:hypothetical protein
VPPINPAPECGDKSERIGKCIAACIAGDAIGAFIDGDDSSDSIGDVDPAIGEGTPADRLLISDCP